MPARNLVWVLIVGTIALLVWSGPEVRSRQQTVYEVFSPLVDVRAEIRKRYIEPVDDKALVRGAIEGMLQDLDPFSMYLSPDEYPRFKQQTTGHFGGIGIDLGRKDGLLAVLSPMENSPAFKAGILADDQILEIDGQPARHLSMAQASQKLMGAPGTQVTLKVFHTLTDQPETITITRAEIELPSVFGWQRGRDGQWNYWIDPDQRIAYIRISAFRDNTPAEFNQALQTVVEGGMQGLILDLRFNPGGSLQSAVAVADRFLQEGVIVSIRGRGRPEESYNASKENSLMGFPIAVLVNRDTASGAEIVSGALRDHGRATVIGERTYGKGSVQEVIELGDSNSAIKLTTALYYLPNGECIHRTAAAQKAGRWGVEPNIVIPLTDAEMRQVLESRNAVDRVIGATTMPATAPARPLMDRQLAKAMAVVREGLAGHTIPAATSTQAAG